MRRPIAVSLAAVLIGGSLAATTAPAVAGGTVPVGAPAAAARRAAAGPRGGDALLGDRVLVKFRRSATAAHRLGTARALGLSKGKALRFGVEAFTASNPGAAVAALRKRADVEWVERELRYRKLAELSNTPERIEAGFDTAHAVGQSVMRGTGITVAVIDDGVDPLNPDLDSPGKVQDGGDYTEEPGASGLVPSGYHGTGIAAIIAGDQGDAVGIAGGAPAAVIRAYRVFDSEGNSSSLGIGQAIANAADDGVEVINLSIGSPFRSEFVAASIDYARGLDVLVVAAAGNEGSERASFPAADPGVLSVGASEQVGTTPSWVVSDYSNSGAVDVIAPGTGVYTWDENPGDLQPTLTQLDGTSYAAPQVAAIAAGLAQHGVLGDRARAAIIASADPTTGSAPAHASGAGRADAFRSLDLVAQSPKSFTAVVTHNGHTVPNAVGRRTIVALRWSHTDGGPDDGPAVIAAPATGTLGSQSSTSRRIDGGRLHTTVAQYSAATAVNDAPSNLTITAAGPNDASSAPLRLRMLPSTNGGEGVPMANDTLVSSSMVRGQTSGYVRTLALPSNPAVDISYTMPEQAFYASLLVWAPFEDGGKADGYDIPVDYVDASDSTAGLLEFPSPNAEPDLDYPSGTYAFGFLLDPYDAATSDGELPDVDDGVYSMRVSAPGGVEINSPNVRVVSDIQQANPFPVTWSGFQSGLTYDVQWTQRYKNSAGQWYVGPYQAWKSGTAATSATFGASGEPPANPTKSYFIRVRGRDSVGNVGPFSAAKTFVVPVDDRYSFNQFAGAWAKPASASAYFRTLSVSSTKGASLTLAGDSAGFTLIGEKCPTCGQVQVFVDGRLRATVDTRASSVQPRQQLFYTGAFSAIGRHTVKAVVVGTAGRPRVALDGIAMIR